LTSAYAELHCRSNFSLLDGGSHPEELIARAKELELTAIAITDRDGLYGAVRFSQTAREEGIDAIIGAELTLSDGARVIALVKDGRGYANLSRLLSRAHMDHPRGAPRISYAELAGGAAGLIALADFDAGVPAQACARGEMEGAVRAAGVLRDMFGRDGCFIEIQRHLLPDDGPRIRALIDVARSSGLGVVATGGVAYAVPEHRDIADVLACIRAKTDLDSAGTLLRANGEYYLRSAQEMTRLFEDLPRAIAASAEIAQRCEFRLGRLHNEFPDFPVPAGETPFSYLHQLVHEGVRRRYRPVSPAVSKQIAHELAVIEKLELAGYFLIVWDIVRFAGEHGILVQGRGSAANSAVCYALNITSVDPVGLELLFERFLSEERDEPPDIDLDTPSGDQREKLIQYVYDRYGRDHAAMVAEVITYRARMAVRDVGKALGLSLDQVDALSKALDSRAMPKSADEYAVSEVVAAPGAASPDHDPLAPHETLGVTKHGDKMPMSAADVESAIAALPAALKGDLGTNVADRLYTLCKRIDGFPRHLSQHSGGMVITRSPLIEVAPLEQAAMPGRTILCWDKDDCAVLGLIKIDILGLGMLDAIERCVAEVRRVRGVEVDLADLKACDDQRVYDMLCVADTVGLFQVESRAQMSSLPRMQPRKFYDIVVQVAIIRPGPIQGDMVHPYFRRRRGLEPVTYPHPSLEPVLARTLGVPLFQEQGMRMAVVAAGFTAGQADELRRAMGHKRSREKMERLRARLVDGMARNGIDGSIGERLYHMLSAFADYGFPESHAASFALIVYVSAYLRLYYPAEFCASLLNAQPMGFYSPATLIGDARRHGVTVLPPDVNISQFECTAEPVAGDGRVVLAGDAPALASGSLRRSASSALLPSVAPRLVRRPREDHAAAADRIEPAPPESLSGASEAARAAEVEPRKSIVPSDPRRPRVGSGGAGSEQSVALRIGLNQVRGIGEKHRELLVTERAKRPYADLRDFVLRTKLPKDILESLAAVGAFGCFGLSRRDALWDVQRLGSLTKAGELERRMTVDEQPVALPAMIPQEEAAADYWGLGLSTQYQVIQFCRERLDGMRVRRASDLAGLPHRLILKIAGVVTSRQRPGTAKGFVFTTMEDETGLVNVIIRPDIYEQYRPIARDEPAVIVEGVLQRQEGTINVLARKFWKLDLADLAAGLASRDFH
jgi:error-prone DNA polymerase